MAKIVGYRELTVGQIEYEKAAQKFSLRSGDWTMPQSDLYDDSAEAQEFSELAESIERFGLIDPIGVRRKEGTDVFEVLFGWRRLAALMVIQHRTGTDVKIPALVWDCTDTEAKAIQIIQSLTTQRLDPCDLALALRMQSEVRDPQISDQELAQELGGTPAFLAFHLQVARCGSKEVLHLWKHDPYRLSLAGMREVVQVDIDKQTLRYQTVRDKELHHDESTDVYFEVKDRIDEIIDGIQTVKGGLGALVSALAQRDGEASDVTKPGVFALTYQCPHCGAPPGVKCKPECKENSNERVPFPFAVPREPMKTIRVVAENYSVQRDDGVTRHYGEQGKEVGAPRISPVRALLETLRKALAVYDQSADRCTEPCELCEAVDELREILKETRE